ncbi:MAG: hypothetical protein ABIK19_05070 [candidate division WOR-3 bacterium]
MTKKFENKWKNILPYVSLFLIIFLISNCGKPIEKIAQFKIVSQCPNPGYAQSIWVDTINNKHYAFLASGQAGLVIYNIDNPESTYIVNQWLDSINSCWDVTTLHGYAYLAYGKRELIVLDARITDSLQYVDEYNWPFPGNSRSIFIQDTSYIFVGALDRLLVSAVATPAYPDEYNPPSNVRGIFIVDSFAYIASEQLGVYIMNVLTTPRRIINLCNTPSNARGVFADEHYCYVADGRNGLVIIDVTNPYQPSIVSQLSLSGYANKPFVKDTLAYVACGEAGLAIVNIKDITNPILVEYVETSYAKSVYVTKDNYIYLADRDLGLVVIKQEE